MVGPGKYAPRFSFRLHLKIQVMNLTASKTPCFCKPFSNHAAKPIKSGRRPKGKVT